MMDDALPRTPFPVPGQETIRRVHAAAEKGDVVAVVGFLDRYGPAAVELKRDGLADDEGTLLMRAAHSGCEDLVKTLLDRGADLNARNAYGATAFFYAAAAARKNIMSLLLDRGVPVDGMDEFGATVLMHAAIGSKNEVASFLLGKGADVNFRNDDGRTALMAAAEADDVDMVRLLLEKGADPDIKDEGGLTALENARACDSISAAEAIVQWVAFDKIRKEEEQKREEGEAVQTRLERLIDKAPPKPVLKRGMRP